MHDRVLVTTDLDPATVPVLEAAVAPFAGPTKEIGVCHVTGRSDYVLGGPHLDEVDVAGADAALDPLRAWSSMFLGERPRELLLEHASSPHVGIVRVAERWRADLVAVAASGASDIKRMLLGTVADRVVRHVHASVLVARRSPRSAAVLVATDLSEASFTGIGVAADEARRRGGTLVVIHVVDGSAAPFYASGSGAAAYERRVSARSWLHHAMAKSGAYGDVEVHEGSAARVIIERAAAHRAELVVVASGGHTGLSRILLGSVAEQITRTAPCSVLVVRR